MAAFPRTVASRITTPPEMPDGMEQWGISGRGQFRAFNNMGRTWQEIYPSIDIKTANGRALLAAVNRARREKIIWTVQHPHWKTNYGAGGGSPTVDGAGQSGSTLDITNGPASTTNWLRDGDIISVTGTPVVLDVVADVDTDVSGNATISIHPPIFSGYEPANGASVEIDPTSIWFNAVVTTVQVPDIESNGVMGPGLTLVWREQPSAS